mmetsp:Transcript_12421/g.26828  ORF Transcript_12421/g.26828 Transcript_12421/m.26828 type:complete len:244 (+) Transcript_12421:40-771(+)
MVSGSSPSSRIRPTTDLALVSSLYTCAEAPKSSAQGTPAGAPAPPACPSTRSSTPCNESSAPEVPGREAAWCLVPAAPALPCWRAARCSKTGLREGSACCRASSAPSLLHISWWKGVRGGALVALVLDTRASRWLLMRTCRRRSMPGRWRYLTAATRTSASQNAGNSSSARGLWGPPATCSSDRPTQKCESAGSSARESCIWAYSLNATRGGGALLACTSSWSMWCSEVAAVTRRASLISSQN